LGGGANGWGVEDGLGGEGGNCTIRRRVDEGDRLATFREEWVVSRDADWPAVLIAERNMGGVVAGERAGAKAMPIG